MRYQHLKTTRKLKKILLPTLPILVVAVLLIGNISFPPYLAQAIHTLAYPLWMVRDTLIQSVADTNSLFRSKENLVHENTVLKNELSKLRRETFLTNVYQKENVELRRLLNRSQNTDGVISASVIHGVRFSPYDTFIIDIGADEGIRDEMLVLTPEGTAVGAVTNTLQHSALVTQFSAPGMTVHSVITSTTSFQTLLTGYGGGTLRVSIPRDVELSVGDSVVLPSLEPYLIGIIASIEVSPEDAFKTLYVRNPLNIHELRHVLVDTTTVWKEPQTSTTTTTTEPESTLPVDEETE